MYAKSQNILFEKCWSGTSNIVFYKGEDVTSVRFQELLVSDLKSFPSLTIVASYVYVTIDNRPIRYFVSLSKSVVCRESPIDLINT